MADNAENALVTLDISGGWDPHTYVNSLFHSDRRSPNGFNFNHYTDDRTDELIDSGLAESDPERRADIYRELQERLARQVPISIVRSGEETAIYRCDAIDDWRQYPLPGSEYDAVYTPYGREFSSRRTVRSSSSTSRDGLEPGSGTDERHDLEHGDDADLRGLLAVDFEGRYGPRSRPTGSNSIRRRIGSNSEETSRFTTVKRSPPTTSARRSSATRDSRETDVYDWYEDTVVIDETELEIHLEREYGPFEVSVGVPIVPLAASEGRSI